jgi:hypothetical protein
MMRELTERFRYRVQLWRREQREDSFWRPEPTVLDLGPASKWNDPKYRVLLTESTSKFVLRGFGLYFGGLMCSTVIARLILRLAPTAQFTAHIVFLVLVSFWTLLSVSSAIHFRNLRKAYREQATESSNKTLQPTPSRRDSFLF